MSNYQRQELIIKKMKAKGTEVGKEVSDKKYNSAQVYELIHVVNYFPELRDKKKLNT